MKHNEKTPPVLRRFHSGKKNGQLQAVALRQTEILKYLYAFSEKPPKTRLRTSISKHLVQKFESAGWQNLYSAVHRDIDDFFLKYELLKEEGRLHIKRGPKALQAYGMPYYGLTEKGKTMLDHLIKLSDFHYEITILNQTITKMLDGQ